MKFYRIIIFLIACYMVYTGGPIWIWLLLPAFIGWTKSWQEGSDEVKRSGLRKKAALVAVVAFVALILAVGSGAFDKNEASKTGTESNTSYKTVSSIKRFYQENYPMVWGYIQKNADDPDEYIKYYNQVWGDLQRYTGDGINFDTLTRYEQSLVNYPPIGSWVYFASSKSNEYHSTSMFYTLLKSSPVFRPSSQRHNYYPCSKCVGD